MSDALAEFLDRVRAQLARHVEREAPSLLRHEDVDDVVQGIAARALQQGGSYEHRSDAEGFAWLKLIARQFVLDRQRYWQALRRQGGHLLRVTMDFPSDSSAPGGVVPLARNAGPATYAIRREMLEIAARAVEGLLPRDQHIVRLSQQGRDIKGIADELGIAYDAAEQARRRAFERFQRAFELLSR